MTGSARVAVVIQPGETGGTHGHETDTAADRRRQRCRVGVENPAGADRWREKTEEDAVERGLTRPIAADHRVDAASRHLEGHGVEVTPLIAETASQGRQFG